MSFTKAMHVKRASSCGLFLTLCAVFFLGGCASLPSPSGGVVLQRDALRDFSLTARFALRQEENRHSGHLDWRHQGERDELLLSTPFGQGVAEVYSAPGRATLKTNDGKSYFAENVETLTQQVLGYPLPLSNLAAWLLGRQGFGGGELAVSDAFGRPLRLLSGNWQVDYEYDSDDAQALPARLFVVQQGGLELRLRIDEWASLPVGGAQ